MELDHIAVAAGTLAEATRHVEDVLGVALAAGGAHEVYGTHNTLLGLPDGLYLEAIAVDPQAVPQRQPRWFDLDRFAGPPRLSNWICRCKDLDATLAALPAGFGTPVSLSRGDLRWRMAVPDDGILPFDNCAPALIEWEGDSHPAQMLPVAGPRLAGLTVQHPQAQELAAVLAPFLDDPRVRFEAGDPALVARFEQAGAARALR